MLFKKLDSILPKKTFAVSLAILILATPILAQQTTDDYAQSKADGARDAKGNPAWFCGGFLCGIFGAGAAFFTKPSPPAPALIGKSSEYIQGYTEGYQNKARNENTMYACGGWLFAVVVVIATSLTTDASQ